MYRVLLNVEGVFVFRYLENNNKPKWGAISIYGETRRPQETERKLNVVFGANVIKRSRVRVKGEWRPNTCGVAPRRPNKYTFAICILGPEYPLSTSSVLFWKYTNLPRFKDNFGWKKTILNKATTCLAKIPDLAAKEIIKELPHFALIFNVVLAYSKILLLS